MLHSWQRALKFDRNFYFGIPSSDVAGIQMQLFFLPFFSLYPILLITLNPFMFSVYLGNVYRRLKLAVS